MNVEDGRWMMEDDGRWMIDIFRMAGG